MLHTINIAEFHNRESALCLSDDFILASNIDDFPHASESFKTPLLLFFFCMKGHVRLTLDEDEKAYALSSGDVFICQPGRPVMSVLHSSDCDTRIVGYMPRVVDHLMTTKQDTWAMLRHAFANPIVRYGEKFLQERFNVFFDMITQRANNPLFRFAEQQSVHLFASLLFEIINQAIRTSSQEMPRNAEEGRRNIVSRTDSLFHEFINLLTADEGCHRTVTHYADLLCISPKHLSNIIRRKTGRKALDVINEHAVEQIKLDLKLSDTAISQLADKYNFTNFSFFCQFVKSHLGMTPQEYRAK